MPKRVNLKSFDYLIRFAPLPACRLEPWLADYVRCLPPNSSLESKCDWFLRNPNAHEQFQLMARESDANSDHWKTRFVSCQDYFAAYRQLSLPFFVFNWVFFTSLPTYGASGWPCWDVQFTEQDVPRIQAALNEEVPLCWFPAVKGRLCKFVPPIYFFGSEFWTLSKSEEAASPEELRLLFLEAVDQGRQKLERLRRKFSGGAGARIDSRRDVIPEDVRIFVWRRDGGRCVQCGGNERLEFDHIIPVSKGGGNTERNIQLLCENCNRKKSDNI